MTLLPPSSILFPSGQSNFFDYTQFRNDLNNKFPDPKNYTDASGLYKTYPSGAFIVFNSGILHANELVTKFSSSSGVYVTITNLNVFGDYIHYYKKSKKTELRLPFVSTYKISPGFDPYPRIR